MAEFKHSLQLSFSFMLLLASIAAHAMSARILPLSSPLLFPQNLIGSRKGHNIEGIHDVKTYLKHYGYLTHIVKPDAFDDHLESAVKTYQTFFKLNVSGVLDKETLSIMSQPRCGVPDIFPNETSSTGLGGEHVHMVMGSHYTFFPRRPKWPESKYNLRYKFIHDYPAEYKEPVNGALQLWSFSSHFSFTEAGRDELDDIKISFEKGEHEDGRPFVPGSGVLAHAFAPQDGRLHFNVDQKWLVGAFEGCSCYDVQSTALHEIGHLLGLGHSATQDAIMWPQILPGTIKGIYTDDMNGLKALYGFP